MENKYFKKFFICPHCGGPLWGANKEDFLTAIHYCGHCGKRIDDALMEALVDLSGKNNTSKSSQHINHFKVFFVCPHCGIPQLGGNEDELGKVINDGLKYCIMCGNKIANALVEALADLKTKDF